MLEKNRNSSFSIYPINCDDHDYVSDCKLKGKELQLSLYVAIMETLLVTIELIIDIKQTNGRNSNYQAKFDLEDQAGITNEDLYNLNEGKTPLLK